MVEAANSEDLRRHIEDHGGVPVNSVGPGSVMPARLTGGDSFIGDGHAAQATRDRIARIAPTSSTALITGETGTGKELVANLIHRNSSRRNGPFVCVNCAAVPSALLESELFGYERGAFTGAYAARDGLLRAANGGTVFLDEIGDMDLSAQSKILRVLETRRVQRLGGSQETPIDVRIVAATNRDLDELVKQQLFRADLFYRLNVVRIRLLPLRQRKEDIPLIFAGFVREFALQQGKPIAAIHAEVIERLCEYEWPGNIRELRNVAEACCIFSDAEITVEHLAPEILNHASNDRPADRDRDRILFALRSNDWNKSKAAAFLQCSRMTLYRKMRELRINLSRPGDKIAVA